jgi:plastocyanin
MRILLLACAGSAAASLACALGVQAAQIAATVSAGAKPVADAVVFAVPEAGVRPADKPPQGVVDQIDKEFVPYVTPIRVGTLVQFPNRDHIRHHVYSFSPPKQFELPLYVGTPANPVLFDKPGVVKLGCNIHDWMIGYIYVSETPYLAKTGPDGRAVLPDLPAGRYRVRVWHPRMQGSEDATVKSIELTQNAEASVSWELELKPEFRPRRAPLPGDPGYR